MGRVLLTIEIDLPHDVMDSVIKRVADTFDGSGRPALMPIGSLFSLDDTEAYVREYKIDHVDKRGLIDKELVITFVAPNQ